MPTAMPDEPLASRFGNAPGSTIGSLAGAIVGRAEIDRVLVDAVEKEARDLGHARLGVAHGGGVIAVDVAEVALPVDQRIADGELLREAHQRVVDRLVAMRVVLAHDVADDLGGLLVGRAGIEPQLAHAVEDAAMDRLQPVAHVRQRAVHDRGEGVGEVALFERLAEVDRLDIAAGPPGGIRCLAMGVG